MPRLATAEGLRSKPNQLHQFDERLRNRKTLDYDRQYLPGWTIESYVQYVERNFPRFASALSFERPDTLAILSRMDAYASGFENQEQGGRGELYRLAQTNASVRLRGIRQLLDLASPGADIKMIPADYRILDVLGGDGIIARAFQLLAGGADGPVPILTGDIVADMVSAALNNGLPAIRQPAQQMFIRDDSLDAVIVAYGTHHIPLDERLLVCQEAFRVLKPRGRIVLHDFEESEPVANWFSEVVDRYSLTGHDCPHFTHRQMYDYLHGAGFSDIETRSVYDPFVVSADTEASAYSQMMRYVSDMYGLVKLPTDSGDSKRERAVASLIERYITYDYSRIPEAGPDWVPTLSSRRDGYQYVVELPRVALVATGTK